ncbi:MAG TPA: response regulator, partial [Labilithrix sp.]|nr:response regulator [Labilithrix sp.]
MSLPAVLARGAEFAESTNGRNETDGAFRGKSASVVRSSVVRSILGLLPVPVTFVFQLALWHAIRPFALFLFVPAVYLSSWVGGFFVGIASTFAAAALAFYFFIRPERAWVVSGTGHSVVLALFVALGVVMSAFHLRFKRANQALAQALESGRRGNMLLRRANEEVSRLYEQTKHSDELRAQIFAGVTHELRTPLTLVLGPAERLCIAPGLDTAFRKEAELIARNARTLLHYVDDLIEVTKLEAGSVAPEYAESDVARISRFVASFFEVAARAKHMSFVLDVPPSLRAEVDPERLERVLLNILSNAFKFTPEHGRVRFGLREDEAHERIVFEVADSGPGIPVDKRQAVFDAYVQLEGRTSRRFAGTGLGLTIARELVELQRGHIEISDAPEGGTLFRVDLPLRASPGTRVEPSDDRSGVGMAEARSLAEEVRPLPCVPEALSGRSDAPIVLVVEDNPDMNEVLCECLRSDFRVARAFDGKEALRSALELAPDLVITDVMMPEMNGEELVRAMRARPELAATPIIVLTAVADEEARVRFLREGARDYVTKPFRMEELRARATSAIADRRAEQEIRRLSARIEAVSRASMSVYEAVAARPKHSVDAVLQTVASQAQILTAAKYVAAGLGTDPEQPFTSWCVVGMSREQGAAIGQRPLVGVLAQVAREGHALRLHDLTTHPEHFALPPGHPEMKSFLGVPIRYRDRVIGYLYLANKQGADEFTQADQSAVQMLADRAGGALETAHRYQAEGTERAWLEAVVEGLPDAAIVLDSAGHLASLNRVASALRRPDDGRRDPLGNPIPLELRRPNGEIVPPGELPYVRAFSRGESVLDVELEIQKPDGELLPVSARAVTVLGPDGKPTGA